MKALLLSSLLVFGSFSVSANDSILYSTAMAVDVVYVSTADMTLIPLEASQFTTCGLQEGGCPLFKEVALAAKTDAQDYLVGQDATDSLVKAIDSLRASFSELETASDEEIAQMIATL